MVIWHQRVTLRNCLMMYSTHFVNGYMASEGQIKERFNDVLHTFC